MKKFNPLWLLVHATVIISLLTQLSLGLPPDETFYETVIALTTAITCNVESLSLYTL